MTNFAKKNTLDKMFFSGPHLFRKVANMQKSNALKKLYLAYFLKSDYKIASFQKIKKHHARCLKKTLDVMFLDF